jgi:Ca2+-transporting ATPase
VALAVMGVYAGLLHQAAWVAAAAPAAFTVLVVANAALLLPSRASQPGWLAPLRGMPVPGQWVIGLTLVTLAGVCTWPPVSTWFGFQAMPVGQWLACALGAVAMLLPFQLNRQLFAAPKTNPLAA